MLFPGQNTTTSPLSRQAADKALRQTCKRIGLSEVSRHSFRRTAAQDAVGRGLPLHVVQALTGHRSLGSLGEYLQASESELLDAIGA
ncbi:MAG: tyrosine-type recombinase/integrase [Synechococcus sp.]